MTSLLPSPEESNRRSQSRSSSRRQGKQGAKIPSIDAIAEMLLKLNSLVMMRLITTAQATVIQRSLQTILQIQTNRASGGREGLSQEALAELCQMNPRIVNWLEPFLTEEQVNWLMGVVKDDPDGQA